MTWEKEKVKNSVIFQTLDWETHEWEAYRRLFRMELPRPAEKGGWVGPFYPDSKTRFLNFYSRYFRTAEMDATFYERFYSKMTQGTFIGIGKAAAGDFQFSLKVLETITHIKRMRPDSFADFEAFLEKN